MPLTYADISQWIEPIAERSEWEEGSRQGHMLRLRGYTMWFTDGGEWDGNGFTPFCLAELCAMHLIRRLNASGVHVKIAWNNAEFIIHVDGKPSSRIIAIDQHPLSAIAEFAAAHGIKQTASAP